MRILDFGCGPGTITIDLADRTSTRQRHRPPNALIQKVDDMVDTAGTLSNAVVALKDDYMLAWLRLAECAMTAERWPEAKEAAEKALALGIAQDHQGPQAEARAMLMEIEDEL